MTTTADVCPRCGEIGSKVSADSNRFHCLNGHVWGMSVEQPGDDPVNAPAHYCQGPIECRHAIASAVVGLSGIEAHFAANAIKYLWRWKHKDGLQDLRKAIREIEMLVETLEGK